jgi:hypothetical protein
MDSSLDSSWAKRAGVSPPKQLLVGAGADSNSELAASRFSGVAD